VEATSGDRWGKTRCWLLAACRPPAPRACSGPTFSSPSSSFRFVVAPSLGRVLFYVSSFSRVPFDGSKPCGGMVPNNCPNSIVTNSFSTARALPRRSLSLFSVFLSVNEYFLFAPPSSFAVHRSRAVSLANRQYSFWEECAWPHPGIAVCPH